MKKEVETDLPGTLVVSHGAAGMAAVKDPAKVLGEFLVQKVLDDTR